MSSKTPVIFLDPRSEAPVYLQIAQSLMKDITEGRLQPGDRLPGYRALSEQLGLNRNTVMAAYQELAAEGWVVSNAGGGSRVAEQPPRELPSHTRFVEAPPKPSGPLLGGATGTPDPRLLPTAALARAYRRAMKSNRMDVFHAEEPQGHPRLRQALAELLNQHRGIAARPEHLFLASGSQMALFLLAQALVGQGDAVAVEALGSRDVWEVFQRAGARVLPVAVDDIGLDVDALEQVMKAGPLRAIFLTPQRQYPTLAVLSAERRARLIELAEIHQCVVLEYDPDSEFHFEGRPLRPLAGDPRGAQVVHIGTLSKIFSPHVRMGFVHAPPYLISAMRELRRTLDRQGDLALEWALADLIEDGELQRHLNRMQKTYLTRRDALAHDLRAALGDAVRFTAPPGGLAFWVETARGIDVNQWSAASLALGVAFRPGSQFTFDGHAIPYFRLGFAGMAEAEAHEAARRMAKALPSR